MSNDIGVNTDPLKVEIYVENGLIKGRIEMDNDYESVIKPIPVVLHVEEEEKELHIVNQLFKHIYTYSKTHYSNNILNLDDSSLPIEFNFNRYETFDYIIYKKEFNLQGNRRDIWNIYQQSSKEFIPDSNYTKENNSIIKMLENAIMNDYNEILLIFDLAVANVNNLKMYKNKINEEYEYINAKILYSGKIDSLKSVIIKKSCYNDLLKMLMEHNKSWQLILAIYIDTNIFETLKIDNPIFE